jgi:Fe2+ transport system protein FeoA
MQPPQTLDRIARGRRVRVIGLLGDDPIARRLDDLGLRPGAEVEVLRRAPLGDPTVFELHGYQLCLRRSESCRVEVEPIAQGGGERR